MNNQNNKVLLLFLISKNQADEIQSYCKQDYL